MKSRINLGDAGNKSKPSQNQKRYPEKADPLELPDQFSRSASAHSSTGPKWRSRVKQMFGVEPKKQRKFTASSRPASGRKTSSDIASAIKSFGLGKREDEESGYKTEFKFEPDEPITNPPWAKPQLNFSDLLTRNIVNSNDRYFEWEKQSKEAKRVLSSKKKDFNVYSSKQKDENVVQNSKWTVSTTKEWTSLVTPQKIVDSPSKPRYSLQAFAMAGVFHPLPYTIDEMVSLAPINHMSIKYQRINGQLELGSLMICQKNLAEAYEIQVPPEVMSVLVKKTIKLKCKKSFKKYSVSVAISKSNETSGDVTPIKDYMTPLKETIAQMSSSGYSACDSSSEVEIEEFKPIMWQISRYFEPTIICMLCQLIGHVDEKCPLRFNDSECRFCLGAHNKRQCDQVACRRCKGTGHHPSICPNQLKRRGSGDFCLSCKNWGHKDTECNILFTKKYKNFDIAEKQCIICGLPGHLEEVHPQETITEGMLI